MAIADAARKLFDPAGTPGWQVQPLPGLLEEVRAALRAPSPEEAFVLDAAAHALEGRCSRLEAVLLEVRDGLLPLTEGPWDAEASALLDLVDQALEGRR